jgi:hypothetical protein
MTLAGQDLLAVPPLVIEVADAADAAEPGDEVVLRRGLRSSGSGAHAL